MIVPKTTANNSTNCCCGQFVMALKNESFRKHNLETWGYYGGSLDRFDRSNLRERGLYEDLSNSTKCQTSQVCVYC